MRPGFIWWWPKWPTLSPSILASEGLLKSKSLVSPGSPSLPQGGPCLGNLGAESLRTNGAPSCAAHMPTCGVFCGAHCGLCLPSDRPSRSGDSSASSLRMHMPFLRASCGSNPGLPEHSHGSGSICSAHFGLHSLMDKTSRNGSGGSGVLSLCDTTLSAQDSNALGSAVVASTALPASSMLAVPSVGAGAGFAFTSLHACLLSHVNESEGYSP